MFWPPSARMCHFSPHSGARGPIFSRPGPFFAPDGPFWGGMCPPRDVFRPSGPSEGSFPTILAIRGPFSCQTGRLGPYFRPKSARRGLTARLLAVSWCPRTSLGPFLGPSAHFWRHSSPKPLPDTFFQRFRAQKKPPPLRFRRDGDVFSWRRARESNSRADSRRPAVFWTVPRANRGCPPWRMR